ncbi:spindle assembly checkpoint component Mad1 [Pyronema omphalodes]|nr:spindle assembly checkpoint component Mad1 [Pyronema omphalodes]
MSSTPSKPNKPPAGAMSAPQSEPRPERRVQPPIFSTPGPAIRKPFGTTTGAVGNGQPPVPMTTRKILAAARQEQQNEAIRSSLKSATYELQTLKEERQLEKELWEREKREFEKRLEEAGKRCDLLEADKRFLFEKQKETGEKLSKLKEETGQQKVELEKMDEVRDAQEEIEGEGRSGKRLRNEFEGRIALLEQNNMALKEELEAKTKMLEEVQEKLKAKDAEVEELQVEILKLLKKELSEQNAELKTLRETNRSLELVEEEKRSLEGKVKVMDELREALSTAELRISVLQDEKNAWESYFQSEGLEFDSPQSLARALVVERVEKVGLLDKLGRLGPEVIEKESMIRELELETRSLKEELLKLKEVTARDSRDKVRWERQKNSALKEAELLREQLKSYQAEENIYNKAEVDEQKNARIEELESLLEQYKAEVEELKEAIAKSKVPETPSKKRSWDEKDDERLGELTRRNRQLQEDLEQLQQRDTVLNKEIDALKHRLTSMEGTSTRILQLKNNPTAQEQAIKLATLNALKEENAALMAQLEGREGGVKMVPYASLVNCKSEVKAVEKVVAERDKRIMRLREIYSAKALEFGEAVYSLLGYKLHFMPNGKVKATHMFGNDSHCIEFDGETGTMKVANKKFQQEIKDQFNFWLPRKNIPCMLASILLEQYEKSTGAQNM